ncbi:MAG: transposase [Proteobacteria bacterium]|nr:transposase [Pseudomonadota bacterium]MBU4356566.1 transposase [Pseudomonadota bacterium]
MNGPGHGAIQTLHRRGLLADDDYPISTGPLEGTNNKIKTMPQQAYGFRDHEFFKLKIPNLHQTRYALAQNNLLDGCTSFVL